MDKVMKEMSQMSAQSSCPSIHEHVCFTGESTEVPSLVCIFYPGFFFFVF